MFTETLDVVAYGRVSTDKKEQESSLDNQTTLMEIGSIHTIYLSGGKSVNLRVVEVFKEEFCGNTSADHRPGLQACKDYVFSHKEIAGMLVKDSSRLMRNATFYLNLILDFICVGKRIFSLKFGEGNLTSMDPSDQARNLMTAQNNQNGSVETRLKLNSAIEMNYFARGKIYTPAPIFGYKWNPDTKVYTVIPECVESIKWIFWAYLRQGMPFTEIVKVLKDKYPDTLNFASGACLRKYMINPIHVGLFIQGKKQTRYDYKTGAKYRYTNPDFIRDTWADKMQADIRTMITLNYHRNGDIYELNNEFIIPDQVREPYVPAERYDELVPHYNKGIWPCWGSYDKNGKLRPISPVVVDPDTWCEAYNRITQNGHIIYSKILAGRSEGKLFRDRIFNIDNPNQAYKRRNLGGSAGGPYWYNPSNRASGIREDWLYRSSIRVVDFILKSGPSLRERYGNYEEFRASTQIQIDDLLQKKAGLELTLDNIKKSIATNTKLIKDCLKNFEDADEYIQLKDELRKKKNDVLIKISEVKDKIAQLQEKRDAEEKPLPELLTYEQKIDFLQVHLKKIVVGVTLETLYSDKCFKKEEAYVRTDEEKAVLGQLKLSKEQIEHFSVTNSILVDAKVYEKFKMKPNRHWLRFDFDGDYSFLVFSRYTKIGYTGGGRNNPVEEAERPIIVINNPDKYDLVLGA